MNKTLFVVCEGIDCSGKTTTIRRALESLSREGSNYLYSKGLKTGTVAGKFSRLFPCTFSLLLELMYCDRIFVKPNLKKEKVILQDRWYYSVLTHNPNDKKDKILERIFTPYLSQPDILVYFTVSPDRRIERLEKSEKNKDHKFLIENSEEIKKMEQRFLQRYQDFQGHKFIIDTTNLSEEQSGEKLCRIISLYKGKNRI